MTKLSVNVNKFALLRNAREQNTPDLIEIAKRCLDAGADGITVHPRPDGRHVRKTDLPALKTLLEKYPKQELNIEGYPSDDFIHLIETIRPHQVTFVPDPPDALTSSFGWHIPTHFDFLNALLRHIDSLGIRASLFVDPKIDSLQGIELLTLPRAELYTYDYAHQYEENKAKAIRPYYETAHYLTEKNILLNAGHDLNLSNSAYLLRNIPEIVEVSIGHALVCDCLEYGLDVTIKKYHQEIWVPQ